MKGYVDSRVRIENPTPEMIAWAKRRLVLDNPDYYKKVRLGKWTGTTPMNITLYERDGNDMILPFGCASEIMREFPDCPMMTSIKRGQFIDYKSSIKPYDYQSNAIDMAIQKKNGVIVMPCGSGKTQTALEVIARLGVKTLWLTHTQDLLNQSMNRAKSLFGIPWSSYGTITAGKVNIGTGITFATVQTMAMLDIPQYKDTWDAIVVDECHKAIGSPTRVMQFYKVLSNLSCRYKFGITATPKRADGLEQSMFALLGELICEVSRDEVKSTTCPVNVETVHTGYSPDLSVVLSGDGTINYASLVNDLTHNERRMRFVADVINYNCKGATLVLANRVEYLKELQEKCECKSVCLSAMGASKTARAERKEALQKLNSGEIDCIFATYKLAKEGLDIPNLRYVVFATPEKDETTVVQAAGRVGRKAEGKEKGTVIDFMDDFGMFIGWAKKRRKFFAELGYNLDIL